MDAVHGRYLLIKNKSEGIDPLVDRILKGLIELSLHEKETEKNSDLLDSSEDRKLALTYLKARPLYLSDTKRVYIEACLIASKDLKEISEILGISIDILYIYQEVFFNIVEFDKLSLLEHIESCVNEEERTMKIWALSQGLDFIAWRLGKQIQINPVDGLQELFTLAIYKSKEAMFSSNSSDSSKEANKWVKLAMDLARIIKVWVMDSGAARKDIELALESVMPDFKGFSDLN